MAILARRCSHARPNSAMSRESSIVVDIHASGFGYLCRCRVLNCSVASDCFLGSERRPCCLVSGKGAGKIGLMKDKTSADSCQQERTVIARQGLSRARLPTSHLQMEPWQGSCLKIHDEWSAATGRLTVGTIVHLTDETWAEDGNGEKELC
jgi:hypothetical protein